MYTCTYSYHNVYIYMYICIHTCNTTNKLLRYHAYEARGRLSRARRPSAESGGPEGFRYSTASYSIVKHRIVSYRIVSYRIALYIVYYSVA